jgi:hypothetical protein
VDSLFFPAYHTSVSIFLICRPWKFAAVGPGPFGPCINTALAVVLTKYYSSDEIRENENLGARCTYGGKERCTSKFWWVSLRERGDLEDLGVDEIIIIEWISNK